MLYYAVNERAEQELQFALLESKNGQNNSSRTVQITVEKLKSKVSKIAERHTQPQLGGNTLPTHYRLRGVPTSPSKRQTTPTDPRPIFGNVWLKV